MAIDWSITSGWEILAIISLVVGIVLAIMKIYDIVTKKRREKQLDIEKKIDKRTKLPKDPIIQFVNIELYDRFSKFRDLSFDIRNMGDFNTTVYLTKIILDVKQDYVRDFTKSIQDFKKIDIGAKGKKSFVSENIHLDTFGSLKKCRIKFQYSFLDRNGKKIETTSKILDVTLTVPKI